MITPKSGDQLYGYESIAAELRELIASRELAPGQRMPSERDLSQIFGVARETASRALAELLREGLIMRHRGHAFTVQQAPTERAINLPHGTMLKIRMPTAAEARRLGISEGVPIAEVTFSDRTEIYAGDRTLFTFA